VSGPGCIIALKLIFPYITNDRRKARYEIGVRRLRDRARFDDDDDWKAYFGPEYSKTRVLTKQDVEHSLCEYQKYVAAKRKKMKGVMKFVEHPQDE